MWLQDKKAQFYWRAKKAAAWSGWLGKNYSDVFSELPQWKRNAHASNFIKKQKHNGKRNAHASNFTKKQKSGLE